MALKYMLKMYKFDIFFFSVLSTVLKFPFRRFSFDPAFWYHCQLMLCLSVRGPRGDTRCLKVATVKKKEENKKKPQDEGNKRNYSQQKKRQTNTTQIFRLYVTRCLQR